DEQLAERLVRAVVDDHVRVGHHQAVPLDDRAGAHRTDLALFAVDEHHRRRAAGVEALVVDLFGGEGKRRQQHARENAGHRTPSYRMVIRYPPCACTPSRLPTRPDLPLPLESNSTWPSSRPGPMR